MAWHDMAYCFPYIPATAVRKLMNIPVALLRSRMQHVGSCLYSLKYNGGTLSPSRKTVTNSVARVRGAGLNADRNLRS